MRVNIIKNTQSKCFTILAGIAAIILLNACALFAPQVTTELKQLRAGQYQTDPLHTSVIFKINHLGLSTYVGRFNRVQASLDFDPNNMQAAELQARIDINSIDVNNADLAQTLQGSGWFNSAKYPEALFQSHRVIPNASGFRFDGDLTLHGVTQPLSLQGNFIGGATNLLTGRYTLGFTARGQITRSKFGLDRYLNMLGDEVNIEIEAEFLRN